MEALRKILGSLTIEGDDGPKNVFAYVETSDVWINTIVERLLAKHLPGVIFLNQIKDFPGNRHHLIQFTDQVGENPDAFNRHFQAGKFSLINAFPNVDALSRKDCLAGVVEYWTAKSKNTILTDHIPETIRLEVDYAEYLEDSLAEADSYNLCISMEENEAKEPHDREWWILKPAMCNQGYGLHMFSTLSELRGCFQSIDDDENDESPEDDSAPSTMPSSLLRSFVAQRYIASPKTLDDKKFHIRAYIMGFGRLKVFVFREMVILSASEGYQPPWSATSLRSYLTNTALQEHRQARSFWGVEDGLLSAELKDDIFSQVCKISGEIFLAGARTMQSRFNVVDGSFEIFGLDFLIDTAGSAWLLEVNAGPDLHDQELTGRLLNGVLYTALRQTLGVRVSEDKSAEESMVEVLDEKFGQSKVGGVWA